MAATVQGQVGTGASVSWANAETGIKFNRADNATDTTANIPVPTATGTNFSWRRILVLAVTGTSTTSISNRKVSQSGAPATGLALWYRSYAVASYVQTASGNMPPASGSNGATPAVTGTPASPGSYTALSTTPTVYDSATVATSSAAPNGQLVEMVLAVDNLYVGGAGTAIALPNIVLTYDEA